MHRFLLREGDAVSEKLFVIISQELIHQWSKVLRFRVGEKVALFDAERNEYICEIQSITPKIAQGIVLEARISDTELSGKIILAQSILKFQEKFEWILQKGTELGVSEFYPIMTKRTERPNLHKMERLQRILIEATEQCGRCVVPVLHDPIKFEAFLKLPFIVKKETTLLIPHFGSSDTIQSLDVSPKKSVTVCVGPEGGFEEKEVESAVANSGAKIITLGKRVLRSETAAITAAALLASKME